MFKKKGTFTKISDFIFANTKCKSINELNGEGKTYQIKGLVEAFDLINQEIQKNTPIYIFTDYDMDGVGAAVILSTLFKNLKYEVNIHLPKRFSEGYGLNMNYCETVPENSLVITADNGIAAVEQIKLLKEKNCRVVIMDHHLPSPQGLPEADVIVDPNAIEGSTFNGYCGAGLCFKLYQLFFPYPEQQDYVNMIAAISTVADVVPLLEENRKIVRTGLALINQYQDNPITALLTELNVEFCDEGTIGFQIGPVFNAQSRLYDDGATISYNYLVNNSFAYDTATIVSTNEKRKQMVAEQLQTAHDIIDEDLLFGDNPLVVYTTKEQENPFTEGIIGILAGRLAEEYKTPCIVLTETKDGILKGSARTYKDVNIKALLDASNKWLLKYGGHKGAAGMSLNISDVEKFKIDLQKAYNNQGYTFDENLYYDLDLNTANLKSIAEELEKFKPYGEGNPAPVFCGNLYLIPKAGKHYQLMGKNEEHIKLFAKDMSVLGFDLAEKFDKDDYPVNIKGVGNISYNHFGSEKNIQFELIDYEKGTSKPLTALSKSLSEKLKKL